MKLTIDTFVGNKQLNEFMHCGDVFERGKQLADYQQLEVTLTGGSPNIQKLLTMMKQVHEENNMNVILLCVKSVDDILLPQPRYLLEPNVQTISNGHQFGVFKDMLVRLGYQVTTDQHMCVTDICF